MTAAILMAAGYKVGMYSSPHLICFNERIRINDSLITNEQIISFVKDYKEDIDETMWVISVTKRILTPVDDPTLSDNIVESQIQFSNDPRGLRL